MSLYDLCRRQLAHVDSGVAKPTYTVIAFLSSSRAAVERDCVSVTISSAAYLSSLQILRLLSPSRMGSPDRAGSPSRPGKTTLARVGSSFSAKKRRSTGGGEEIRRQQSVCAAARGKRLAGESFGVLGRRRFVPHVHVILESRNRAMSAST